MFQAVEKDDLESIKKALVAGVDINATKYCAPHSKNIGSKQEWFAKDGLQATPTYLAAEHNHLGIFDFLTRQKGFNPASVAYTDRHQRD